MNKKFLLLALFVLILCLMPITFRLSQGNTTIPGIEPYYHLNNINNNETLWEPFNFIVFLITTFLGVKFLLFLPAIIGFTSFLLFWFAMKKLNFNQVWFSFAFVLSPIFILLNFFAFRYGFVLCLILLGIIFFLSKKLKFLGVLLFILAAFSGLTSFFAVIYFTLALLILRPKLKAWCFAVLIFLFFIFFLNHFPSAVYYTPSFSEFFSDLGGLFGIGFFTFILSIMGAVKLWRNKTRYYSLFVLTLAFFVLSYFFPVLFIFGSVIFACLSGTALYWLFKRKWKLQFLKSVSLLLLFCGLLFSTVSHTSAIANSMPNNSFFDAITFEDKNILSHPLYGFWIEYSSNNAIITPLDSKKDPLFKNVFSIFSSTNLMNTNKFLKEYSVDYILITDEMMHGLVWSKEDLGLVYLLKNAKTFKEENSQNDVVVWAVLN